jgi:hypothetical protein
VAFHESFWVATSAAAPVIALAAVVALPDASTIAHIASGNWYRTRVRYRDTRRHPTAGVEITAARLTRWQAWLTWWAIFVNLIVQAGLLAMSLSALAYNHDVMAPPAAIILAAGGILILAWSTMSAFNLGKLPDFRAKAADDSRDQSA